MKEICGCFICGTVFVNHGLEDGQLLLGIYSENKKKILNACDDCNNAVGEFIERRQDTAKEEMLKNELGGN